MVLKSTPGLVGTRRREKELTIRASNSMTMTGDGTRIDDGVDSSHLDGPTDHSPECVYIVEKKAEHEDQKGALESLHRDGLPEGVTTRGRADLEGAEKEAYRKRLGKSSFCSYREGSKDNPLLFWDVYRPQWVNSSDLIGGMIL